MNVKNENLTANFKRESNIFFINKVDENEQIKLERQRFRKRKAYYMNREKRLEYQKAYDKEHRSERNAYQRKRYAELTKRKIEKGE